MAQTTAETSGNMARLNALGVPWWNDSCDLAQLREAVAHGAVGATSNPVIVAAAVEADPDRWVPVIDALVAEMAETSEDEVAWALIAEMGRQAAAILQPVHDASRGRQGVLCLQVNPKFHRSHDRMVEQGRVLSGVAANIAVKVPATEAGLAAVERLTAEGIRVNVTVSFTVDQALAAAEAIERGLKRASGEARSSYVTLMEGRLDDHLKRVVEADGVGVHPAALDWAGVAVFKRASALFAERGYRATLLAAAYRNELHWSQILDPRVVQSMPYSWWRQFDASSFQPRLTLDEPIDQAILAELQKLDDFRRAYEPGRQRPADFASFGASRHTLRQFLEGYEALIGTVRDRMLD